MNRRRLLIGAGTVLALGLLYLLAWPVPVDPVSWVAPPNPGYTGDFAENRRLAAIELFDLGGPTGPEALAADRAGRIYTSTHEGIILRFTPETKAFERWAETGGRPLGLAFAADGRLLVADAYRGLLAIAPDATVTVLADTADGVPIRYADDLDVADDGTVYFSDASTKHGAEANGGTYEASVIDINEHGGHGRLLAYDPTTGTTTTVLDGLQFANGVAMAHDQRSVLVVESGAYQVTRWWRTGPKAGTSDVVVGPFPGFPDNIVRGRDGRYWVGLISPRSGIVDMTSEMPFIRRIFERLPAAIKPKAAAWPHVVAIDDAGRIMHDLQDPGGPHAFTTGVLETDDHLYISSLRATTLARLARSELAK